MLGKKLTAGFRLVELESSRLVPPRQQHRYAPRPESTVLCVRLRTSHAPFDSSEVRAGSHVCMMCVRFSGSENPQDQGEPRKKCDLLTLRVGTFGFPGGGRRRKRDGDHHHGHRIARASDGRGPGLHTCFTFATWAASFWTGIGS